MTARLKAFQSSPSEKVKTWIEAVNTGSVRFFVVQFFGPTSCVIRTQPTNSGTENTNEEDSQRAKADEFKVLIGSLHKCTCRRKKDELCVHIIFVLIKVLRVPSENNMVWQLSLLDSEINRILQGLETQEKAAVRRRHNFLKRSREKHGTAGIAVEQKAVAPGEICSICQEDLVPESCSDEKSLEYREFLSKCTFCTRSCGNCVHIACMKVWAEHRVSIGEKVTCPLCRQDWGPLALSDLKNKQKLQQTKARRRRLHHPSKYSCSRCKMCPIVGHRYRCLICVTPCIDLCEQCFKHKKAHSRHGHPFIYKRTVQDTWLPALRTVGLVSPELPPRELVQDLQSRELTTDDYDLLLSLDEPKKETTDLSHYLVDHMDTFSISQKQLELNCSGCKNSVFQEPRIRLLPCCGAMYHYSCAIDLIASVEATLVCNLPSCGSAIFPGLKPEEEAATKSSYNVSNNQVDAAVKILQENKSSKVVNFSIIGEAVRNSYTECLIADTRHEDGRVDTTTKHATQENKLEAKVRVTLNEGKRRRKKNTLKKGRRMVGGLSKAIGSKSHIKTRSQADAKNVQCPEIDLLSIHVSSLQFNPYSNSAYSNAKMQKRIRSRRD